MSCSDHHHKHCSDPHHHRNYDDVRAMRHLIEQLSGDQPFDPGANYASVLEKVKAGFDHAFRAVAHDPPPGLNIYNSNHINIVCQTFGAFERGWAVAERPEGQSLAPLLRRLTPRMIAWATLFHPERGQMVDPTGTRETGREIAGIIQVYLTILESDMKNAKPLLHAYPDIVVQALELWLGFPRYIAGAQAEEARAPPRPKGSSDFSNLAFGLIGILFYIQNMLAYEGNKPNAADRALFRRSLQAAGVTEVNLYSAIPVQTDFLCNLNMGPVAGPQTWTKHFALLAELVKQADLQPSKIPSAVITSVLSAAQTCLRNPDTHAGAYWATQLIDNMCAVARSNYTLVRAIAGGIFDILYSLDRSNVLYDYQPLAQRLAAGMAHARVLRAFRRRHPHPPAIHNITPRPELFWRDVVQAYQIYARRYEVHRRSGEWQSRLTCYNLQGPHNCTAKICPCGDAAFCSGSCQRMHWEEQHREACCADTGVWGLNGTLSIVDLMFICSLAHEQVANSARRRIATEMARIVKGRSSSKLEQSTQQGEGPAREQFVVLCDLTDAIPNLREKVYTRGVGEYAHPLISTNTVAVEVVMNLGRRRVQRLLPFVLGLDIFLPSRAGPIVVE
ncbi:hypothetical protein EV121DRAFT_215923 [Schizophyllum commune]